MKRGEDSPGHLRQTHDRWIERTHRDLSLDDAPDAWVWNQCEICRYWLPLDRRFTTDWGVCSNRLAQSDGIARFAHDGCDHFVHWDDDVVKIQE
jgi:hypothetical protein